jgi:hypothetical protein
VGGAERRESRDDQGGVVFFSSVLLVVPSGDTVTAFSFVSMVPSLFTFSLSLWETVRSQPEAKQANPKAVAVANNVDFEVFMVTPFDAVNVPWLDTFALFGTRGELFLLWGKTRVTCGGERGFLKQVP